MDVLKVVLVRCSDLMIKWEKSHTASDLNFEETNDAEAIEAEAKPSLIERPADGSSYMTLAIFVLLFPLNASFQLTVPDVRHAISFENPTPSVRIASISVFSSLVWLMGLSFVMVWSLDSLSRLTHFSDTVMGMTLSAAGTSVSRKIALHLGTL